MEKHYIKLIIITVTFEILLMHENPKYNVSSSCPSASNYSPGNQQYGMVSYHPQLPPHLDLLNHNVHILRFIKISQRFPAFSKPLFPIASQLGPQAMGKQRQAIPTVLAEFLTRDCDLEA